ncbi:IclR family transcriptional regulator [Rhodoligotrophos defluvii]|uniref:IclR family transcriptional regulator n=1 Tax=Rhodoligotrophos defluvii TaxID=2561934 RepID=UPI0010C9F664|nr:IclR family transcriptional regulator [Rhodoligotrophos defluvii]
MQDDPAIDIRALETPAADEVRSDPGTGTLDLALRIVEFLAQQPQPTPLTVIARHFAASKATVYRHLHTLVRHGFARRDPDTGRYEVGVKLMVLGESARNRLDLVKASRDELIRLRDVSRQAVTICKAIDDEVVVLELIQGQTVIEFGTRPGTRLRPHASAHGKIWLAFGPKSLMDNTLNARREAFTPQTLVDPAALMAEIDLVRERGWSTAPDEVVTGVNALAAPIFDHRGELAGSVAMVGFTQFIPAQPDPRQVEQVVETARRISRSLGCTLGWRPQ